MSKRKPVLTAKPQPGIYGLHNTPYGKALGLKEPVTTWTGFDTGTAPTPNYQHLLVKVSKDKVGGTLVRVTKKDIKSAKGFLCNSFGCPIARALQRRFNDKEVSVGPRSATVQGRIYDLPDSARQFISKFDTSRAVQPFSFRLESI